MNEYLKEFISLKENYNNQDGDKSSVLALYQFADRLAVTDEKEAKEVLVDVYQLLGMMESAYKLFSTIVNKADRKQIKKLATLQELSKSQADNYALPRPLTEKEEAARRERLKDLPQFRYYPDPVGTGAFEEGDFEEYWDNEPYENEMELWRKGQRDKPSEDLKCGFCKEMDLEELDKKGFWFSVRASLCNARELAKDYITDLDEFERKCKEKGILEGNVIWGVSVEDFTDLEPEACGSMAYVGELEC